MSLSAFLTTTIAISLSGSVSPGPVSAVTIGHGSRNKHAGAMVAVGHAAAEFPLVLLLALGVDALLKSPTVRLAIGLAGGTCLLWMGFGMLRTARAGDPTPAASRSGPAPFTAGALLSAMNPYFYIWWISVGISLVVQARAFGSMGLALLLIIHWSCDLFFLWLMSLLAFKGRSVFGTKFQVGVLAICGLLLVGFGVKFVADAVRAMAG